MATNVYLGRNGNWADTSNWSLGAIPVDADDVVIPETTQTPLTTNLDRTGDTGGAGLDLNSIFVHEGHYGNIGSLGNPLKCTVENAAATEPSILHRGSGELWFNSDTGTGGHHTGMVVINSRNVNNAATISGDRNITRIGCVAGAFTLGAAYSGTVSGVYISGATVACTFGDAAGGVGHVWQSAGTFIAGRPITNQHLTNGVCHYITRAPTNVHQHGGLFIWDSSSVLTNLYVVGGTFDTTRTAVAKTISNLVKFPTATLLRSNQLTVTDEYELFDVVTD